jgi:dihydrofolate reductase
LIQGNVMPVSLVLVAAVAENGIIGRDGGLPWRIKADMAHFRRLTIGHPVVMGRKTYLSLRGPLRQRTNIVVSRNPSFAAAGVVITSALGPALETARGDALRRGVVKVMVIGGGDIFACLIDHAAHLEITRVHARPTGDAAFPPIDPAIWRETARQAHTAGPGDDAAFTTLTFERVGR